MEPIVDVTDVRVLSRYVVELTFETGEVRVIDLEPLLEGSVRGEMSAPFGHTIVPASG